MLTFRSGIVLGVFQIRPRGVLADEVFRMPPQIRRWQHLVFEGGHQLISFRLQLVWDAIWKQEGGEVSSRIVDIAQLIRA